MTHPYLCLTGCTYGCQKRFSWVQVTLCLPVSVIQNVLCVCTYTTYADFPGCHPCSGSSLSSSVSQGVGLFCSDVADWSHSFECFITLNYLGRGERYGEGQKCLCLHIPAGTTLVISNQSMNHPATEREYTVLKCNTHKLTLQAKRQSRITAVLPHWVCKVRKERDAVRVQWQRWGWECDSKRMTDEARKPVWRGNDLEERDKA